LVWTIGENYRKNLSCFPCRRSVFKNRRCMNEISVFDISSVMIYLIKKSNLQ